MLRKKRDQRYVNISREKQRKVFAHNFKITDRIFFFFIYFCPTVFFRIWNRRPQTSIMPHSSPPFSSQQLFTALRKQLRISSSVWNGCAITGLFLEGYYPHSSASPSRPPWSRWGGGKGGGNHTGQVCGVRALSHKQEKWLWHCRLFKSPHWAS